jgi:hypothetical protein
MCSRLRSSVTGVLGLVVISWSGTPAQEQAPTGWRLTGNSASNYSITVDASAKYAGTGSCSILSKPDLLPPADGYGTLIQTFRADRYRARRIRLTAFIKTRGVERSAALWMRIDGREKSGLAFDNMRDRPITGTTDWGQYHVVLDLPPEAARIAFGVLLRGVGQVWADNFRFEVVGKDFGVTGQALRGGSPPTIPADLPEGPSNLSCER